MHNSDPIPQGVENRNILLWFKCVLTALHEILIANPIDWLYAACLEYFIFFSVDSSEARKQYDEYCLSIMQTITYANDRTHFKSKGTIHPVP
jgi:hypothetical protein